MHMQILVACFDSQGCVVYASKHIKMNTHFCCCAVHLNDFVILYAPE